MLGSEQRAVIESNASTIMSEIQLPGATVQMLDAQWNTDARIEGYTSELLLVFRPRPCGFNAGGRIDQTEGTDFGQLILCPARSKIQASTAGRRPGVRLLVCQLNHGWLNEITQNNRSWTNKDVPAMFNVRCRNIIHSMRRLAEELLGQHSPSKSLAESLCISIAVDLDRFIETAHYRISQKKCVLAPCRLQSIHDFINSHDDGLPTLTEVAGECDMSVAHLRRLYKNTTGRTLQDYIDEHRLARAQYLLVNTDLPLKIISYKLGFSHPSAFSLAFKQALGESPREYRNSRGITG